MLIDLLIVLFMISAVVRGFEIGFVQQLCSTIGFFGGLILGALLQPQTSGIAQGQAGQSLIALGVTLGMAFLGLLIGELVGLTLKRKLQIGKLNAVDNGFGSALSIVTVLIAVWLAASVVKTLPYDGAQVAVRESKIASTLTDNLPYAPRIIASLGYLIDPNGFPIVFTDGRSEPPPEINLPPSSVLAAAVERSRPSVVRIIGQGCGGQVNGSGFVAGADTVITNAHVVAGIDKQYVIDGNGTHTANAIWFDPRLDLAILRVSNLAGEPLPLGQDNVPDRTAAAVLGYPGGKGFTANPASVLDQFTATGRDIYGRGATNRSVYEIAANVEQGDSGGPLVSADGTVIGVIFARSTSYDNVGYALTMDSVITALSKANARDTTVDTSSCAG